MDALMERLSVSQMQEWMAYFLLQAEEAEERALEARSQAQIRARVR